MTDDTGDDELEALEVEQLRADLEQKRANIRLTNLSAMEIERRLSHQFESAPIRFEPGVLSAATLDVQSPSQIVLAAGIVAAAALIIAGHPSYGLCFLAAGPALALLPHVTRHFPDLMKDSSSRG